MSERKRRGNEVTVLTSSIIQFIIVLSAFLVLFIIIPWYVIGFKLEKGKCLERIFACLSFSVLTIILIIFLLVFLKILSVVTFYAAYMLAIALTIFLYRRTEAKAAIVNVMQGVERLTSGHYKVSVLLKNLRHKIFLRIRAILGIFFSDTIHNILAASAIGFCVFLGTYHSIKYTYFSVSDLYSHVTWIAFLRDSVPFYRGVYPFGMHNLILSIALAFNIDTVTIIHFFGCVTGMFMIFGLYLFFTKIFHSRAASTLSICVYAFATLCGTSAYARIGISLPQETGFVFLFPAVTFFLNYLRQKDKKDLVYFGAALAASLSCHFYAVIGLFIFCFCIFVTHVFRIFKRKMLLPLIVTVVFAFIAGVLPLGIGLLQGIGWEQSMDWAMGSINVADAEATTPGRKAEIAAMTFEEFQALELIEKEDYLKSLELSELVSMDNVWRAIDTCMLNATASILTLCIYILTMVLTFLVSFITYFIKSRRLIALSQLSMVMCSGIFFAMAFSDYLKIPNIFGGGRITIFNSFCQTAMVGIIAEILFANVFMERHKILSSFVSLIYTSGIVFVLVGHTGLRTPYNHPHAQYEGAVNARYMILEEFPNNSWTIVSPVEELAMVLGHGYHYELWEFVIDLENNNEEDEVIIPTEHLFFYAEKYPLPVWSEDPESWSAEFDLYERASESYSEIFETLALNKVYSNNDSRSVLTAKIFLWAKEYIKYFPNEMTVYYEDDDIIVYHLEQNPYYYNNLMIDYGYN